MIHLNKTKLVLGLIMMVSAFTGATAHATRGLVNAIAERHASGSRGLVNAIAERHLSGGRALVNAIAERHASRDLAREASDADSVLDLNQE